jgi:hypothetical protein
MATPKPLYFNKNKVKTIVPGADPANFRAHAQTTHLAMQVNNQSPQLPKELFFPPTIEIYSF